MGDSALYSCPKYEYKKGSTDFDDFTLRICEDWKARVVKLQNEKYQAKNNLSIKTEPVSWPFIENEFAILCPPLHFLIRFVNMVRTFLKDKMNDAPTICEWERGLFVPGYHGGEVNGNMAKQLLKNRRALKEKYLVISNLLEHFDKISETIFTTGPNDETEIEEVETLMCNFKQNYQNL